MRLPNGYGSVHRLPGNRRRPWRARVTVGWTEDGKQLYYTVGYYATQREALAALAEGMMHVQAGIGWPPPGRNPCGD